MTRVTSHRSATPAHITGHWSLMVFALNSVARESSVVTVVLMVTRRSIASSLLSKAAWLDKRLSILVFKALRVERTKDTKS